MPISYLFGIVSRYNSRRWVTESPPDPYFVAYFVFISNVYFTIYIR